jgi:glycosyltransferase involved in cell wall biosynthesis
VKVSFIIPSFNSSAWLAQAVGSCLEQNTKYDDKDKTPKSARVSGIEVVVVDDASTDSTPDYLAWQVKADSRVSFIRNEKNLGRSVSRNVGNAAAKGDVLCVLDADDLALPNRAKITAEKFAKGIEFLYGSAVRIDACGRTAGEMRADVFNKEKALTEMVNRICHSTVAYTPEFAKKFPYADGEMAKLGLLEMVPNILSAYRVLASAVSSTRDEESVKKAKTAFLDGLKVA